MIRLLAVAQERNLILKEILDTDSYWASLSCRGGYVTVYARSFPSVPDVQVDVARMKSVDTIRARVDLPLRLLLVRQAVGDILEDGEDVTKC